MKSLYIVTAIADGIIKVSPASVLKMTENGTTEQSMTGNALTAKNMPQSIQVTNPRSFLIECGSAVYIGFCKTAESFRGIAALLVPILIAGAALYCAPSVAALFTRAASPLFKAAFTSAFFLAAAAAVFFISRRADITVEPRITSLAPPADVR